MRIIHTADIHLGMAPDKKRSWSGVREKEIWKTFEELTEHVKEENPDIFIIAGDLFHRAPLEKELREVAAYFAELRPIPVVLIAGNHDYVRKNSCYETYEWSDNVIFLKGENIERVSIDTLNVDIYGLSYHNQTLTEPVYDNIVPENPERINILVAHGGDADHAPMNFSQVTGNGFDYIACGHLHTRRWGEHLNYGFPGPLEPLDYTETGEHGFLDVQVEKEACRVTFVPFAKRSYKKLHIPVDLQSTQTGLRKKVSTEMEKEDDFNLFHIVFEGPRNPDFEIDQEEIYLLGNVVKVEDLTHMTYDYEKLLEENQDNMLGMFIHSFSDGEMSEIEKKALAYGVQALLEER